MEIKMDFDALQKALNDNGKITEKERAFLIKKAIPDRLMEALEDGIIDAHDDKDLRAMGFSEEAIACFVDGYISDDEKEWLRQNLSRTMEDWREKEIKNLLKRFKKVIDHKQPG